MYAVMMIKSQQSISRRAALGIGALTLGSTLSGPLTSPAIAAFPYRSDRLKPALLRRALIALERHQASLVARDVMAIADFSAPSREPRFHLVNVASGATTTLMVAHGRGSDPGHSGWLQRFSNTPGSAASSAGAYRTGDLYVGKHGQSRRLIGLEPENNNAESRAIVIHAAWYVGPEIVRDHGKLGRSEGCFAVSERDLAMVLDRLGSGRLLYADKV